MTTTATPTTASRNGNSAKLGDTIWPVKNSAEMPGDLILGGLMMVHEREDTVTCGPVMPQGGVQALETMLYTLDVINSIGLLPNFTIGAHVLDDCDKDTYGLEMAVDFIKGESNTFLISFGTTLTISGGKYTPLPPRTLKNHIFYYAQSISAA
ncbi:UNVERIFIED_CONTAM: hypothetical protein PYX00_010140 [Menopon gallinae]|uniref:Receptor ligand binding region domain-containing protein n=1 Tax=Menopon gallinae TaxID=328185 RepID=A0AAW2HEF2_9NEOP